MGQRLSPRSCSSSAFLIDCWVVLRDATRIDAWQSPHHKASPRRDQLERSTTCTLRRQDAERDASSKETGVISAAARFVPSLQQQDMRTCLEAYLSAVLVSHIIMFTRSVNEPERGSHCTMTLEAWFAVIATDSKLYYVPI